jgi:hypothetical protein
LKNEDTDTYQLYEEIRTQKELGKSKRNGEICNENERRLNKEKKMLET